MNDRWVRVRGRWVRTAGDFAPRRRGWYAPRQTFVVRAAEVPVAADPNASFNWTQITAGVVIGVLAAAIVGRLA